MAPEEWLNLRNFGEKSRTELNAKLEALGLNDEETVTDDVASIESSEETDIQVEDQETE